MTDSQLIVTGGTGFIGGHLVRAAKMRHLRVLTRVVDARCAHQPNVSWIKGDLASSASWQTLLVPGCTLINLAYPAGLSDTHAVEATKQMVRECARLKVNRLIHCSTVSVYGRVPGGTLNELTPCNPLDSYSRKKLAIEQAIRDTDPGDCEVAILRPTVVFGSGSQNLVSLMKSLCHGSSVTNYLRRALFGNRHMHLIPVRTVIESLLFLSDTRHAIAGQIFHVSDSDPLNNFRDVERIIREAFGLNTSRFPCPPLPTIILRIMLRSRGRSDLDPYRVYSNDKLHNLGFTWSADFKTELLAFASFWRKAYALGEQI
jgi:nucleoside-diphosphate-sugar epimerase